MSASKTPSLKYSAYVQGVNELYEKASGNVAPTQIASLLIPDGLYLDSSPKVLIVAPHPDDECLMAGYALRMKQEWNAQVSVLSFSFGSKDERRCERKSEMADAVEHLGFQLVQRLNLEKISRSELLNVLQTIQPQVVFSPHADDGHATHIETSKLVGECIQQWTKAAAKKVLWVQSEFWRDMKAPNVLIPYTVGHVTLLGEALMKHVGEVERNPYHLRMPAWLMDQVRKGSETVSEHGAKAMNTTFGQIFFQSIVG